VIPGQVRVALSQSVGNLKCNIKFL
jgi:hypothetical protein